MKTFEYKPYNKVTFKERSKEEIFHDMVRRLPESMHTYAYDPYSGIHQLLMTFTDVAFDQQAYYKDLLDRL